MLSTVSFATVSLWALAALSAPQFDTPAWIRAEALPTDAVPEQGRSFTIEGRVVLPGGAPALGAVVVSSAGGLAAVEPDGSFRLAVELPSSAEAVQISAAWTGSGGTLRASREVLRSGAGDTGSSGTMELSSAPGCELDWLPGFGGNRGPDGPPYVMASFDDGSGPALYVGGDFVSAGGQLANRLARWDGNQWSAVGGHLDGGVRALQVFDDGNGPALYVGGFFSVAGGVPADRIARWDGTSWTSVGSGMDSHVLGLAVYDDGNGPALYAAGGFTTAGGVPANRVARWDGSSWSALGAGIDDNSGGPMAVFDDGTGSALYVGGSFTSVSGSPMSRIARWDGSLWSSLGTGIAPSSGASVDSLVVHDDGLGQALYAGGFFNGAGGVPGTRSIARWNGNSWSSVGGGFISTFVYALAVHDEGLGPALFVGGTFLTAGGSPANRIARWNGSSWSNLGQGVGDTVRSLGVHDEGSGPALFVAGSMLNAGNKRVQHIARWKDSTWSALGPDAAPDGGVAAIAVYDDGAGPHLYVGGGFTTVNGVQANGIVRYDGTALSSLTTGVVGSVYALAVYDPGTGPLLCVGGNFSSVGGSSVENLAAWNGSSWSTLGSGTFNESGDEAPVYALTAFEDSMGSWLYAGGSFDIVADIDASNIARWNGIVWMPLGSGVSGSVHALQVFDHGLGDHLYVGGAFFGHGSQHILRYRDGSWFALPGGGTNQVVRTLAVFDDSNGPALFLGGEFTIAGGISAARIARFDGSNWSTLGQGMNQAVSGLGSWDDGTGDALYAGGFFTVAGGTAAHGLARWDGTSWAPIPGQIGLAVKVFTPFDDGSGEVLFLGGSFPYSPAGDSYLTRWGCAEGGLTGIPYCFGDGSGTACPCNNSGASGAGCANSTGSGATLVAQGPASVSAAQLVLTGASLPPNQSGLYIQAQNQVSGGQGNVLGDGLRCAGGNLVRLQVRTSGAVGSSSTTVDIPTVGGVAAGDTRTYQLWYRDPTSGPCNSGFNLTNGLSITWAP